MRVKNGITWMRLCRDATHAPGADVEAYQTQADAPTPRLLAIFKATALATIAVAMAWAAIAASGVTTDADLCRPYREIGATHANHSGDAPRDCSARYAALLDLAELARRDGKSSEVVVRALSDRRGAMSECLPVNRAETAKP
jgi:hypothetical protein